MITQIVTPGRDAAIDRAFARASGARYYKSALQVNPLEYLDKRGEKHGWANPAEYDEAIVAACVANGIGVIAVTDHKCVRSSQSLLEAAQSAGIAAFPGFEVTSSDSVHVLVIFAPGTPMETLEGYLAQCGFVSGKPNDLCRQRFIDLVAEVGTWGAVAIAPHITAKNGLLSALSGKSREAAWKSEALFAVAIPGPLDDVPLEYRQIIDNKDPNYRRERPLAILNARDVVAPSQLSKRSVSTRIKMATPSIEGLRQAFLDPGSRVRSNFESSDEPHSRITAFVCEGGFLDGVELHFNERLNVLVGGRGTGKSTVLESLRYLFGLSPLDQESQRTHERIVRTVLKSGTKIAAVVNVLRPTPRTLTVERTVPNAAIVRDENGTALPLNPREVLPGLEIFGQHEIAQIAQDSHALTGLLSRLAPPDHDLIEVGNDLASRLTRSQELLVRIAADRRAAEDRTASLPGLRETLTQYRSAGLEQQLKNQTALMREQRVVQTFDERLTDVDYAVESLGDMIPLDEAFVSQAVLGDLPGAAILAPLRDALAALSSSLQTQITGARTALAAARARRQRVMDEWKGREALVNTEYERILRQLQKQRIDGQEYLRLERRVQELGPIALELQRLSTQYDKAFTDRAELLRTWIEHRRKVFQRLATAAKRVVRRTDGRVDVKVAMDAEPSALIQHFKALAARITEVPKRRDGSEFAISVFADEVFASDAVALASRYELTSTQVEKLLSAPLEWKLELQALDLGHVTSVHLNVGTAQAPQWRALESLSAGQKATAVLMLLLIDAAAPLLIDQPEDDLDNRFLMDGVVQKLREAKDNRQFIFATHNANIPVLGDAELIVGMQAAGGGAGDGNSIVDDDLVGSIDTPTVAAFVEEILEGGKAAFLSRRAKYGF